MIFPANEIPHNTPEEAGMIKELLFDQDHWDKDGQKRVRLLEEDGHFRLQFGIRYKDKPEMFVTAQQLVIHPDAVMPIKEILGLIR